MAKSKTKRNAKVHPSPRNADPRKKKTATNASKKKRHVAKSSTAKRRTKTDRILALLSKPEGTTLKAIMAATGWQAHSVRGFISGYLVKKLRLRVKSSRRDGESVRAPEMTGLPPPADSANVRVGHFSPSGPLTSCELCQ